MRFFLLLIVSSLKRIKSLLFKSGFPSVFLLFFCFIKWLPPNITQTHKTKYLKELFEKHGLSNKSMLIVDGMYVQYNVISELRSFIGWYYVVRCHQIQFYCCNDLTYCLGQSHLHFCFSRWWTVSNLSLIFLMVFLMVFSVFLHFWMSSTFHFHLLYQI